MNNEEFHTMADEFFSSINTHRQNKKPAVPTELISDLAYEWWLFQRATNPVDQAAPLLALGDRISDLMSYHPGWDAETGTMPWERGEDTD